MPRPDADPAQAPDPLLDREKIIEYVEPRHQHVVPVRDEFTPALASSGVLRRCLEQPEIHGLPVAADHPALADVIHRILVPADARQEHLESQRRIVERRAADFRRDGTARVDQQEAPVFRQSHGRVERLVLFLVDDRVARGIGAEFMDAHAQSQQRDRILLDVQHAAVVCRPHDAFLDVRDHVRQQLTRHQRLEAQRVLATTHGIFGEREQAVVVADLDRADVVVIEPARVLAQVEQDLLGALDAAGTARVNGIFVAGVVAMQVPVAVVAVGNAGVVLADAPDDLPVQLVFKRLPRRSHRCAVRVLGAQVLEHVGRRARVVAQPVIVVHPDPVRRRDLVWPDRGDRGRERPFAHGVQIRRPPAPCARGTSDVRPLPGSTASSSARAR